MATGARVAELGDNLRSMARELSEDINECAMLTHAALAGILRDDPALTHPHADAYVLRTALWSARWRERAQAKISHRRPAHAQAFPQFGA